MSTPDEWVELSGEIIAQTDRAVCFEDGGGGKPVWLPRSQIRPADIETGPAKIEVQYWLAHQEGLI
jgi:hypothetical protein